MLSSLLSVPVAAPTGLWHPFKFLNCALLGILNPSTGLRMWGHVCVSCFHQRSVGWVQGPLQPSLFLLLFGITVGALETSSRCLG